jgi:hypothetical protein
MFAHLTRSVQPVLINGVAGIVSRLSGGEVSAITLFIVKSGRITEIDVRDPERLRKIDLKSIQ